MFSVNLFCCAVLPYLAPTFSQFSWANRTIFFTSSVTSLCLKCCTRERHDDNNSERLEGKLAPIGPAGEGGAPYVGFGAVVTADVRVILAEALVELELAKVGQQLDATALHSVLAEVHHAVKVVEMSVLGLSVPLSVHCEGGQKGKKKGQTFEGSVCNIWIF